MANQNASSAAVVAAPTSSSTETVPNEDLSQLCKKLQTAVVNLVRQSNKLPMLGDGHELYSSFADYAEFMRIQRNRIIIQLRRLTNYQCRLNESVLGNGMDPLVGFCDSLIDRAAIALDEHQRSLTRDRIRAREILLGAEEIRDTGQTPCILTPSSSTTVQSGSAADAFSKSNSAGSTFRDGGGRFAMLATTTECTVATAKSRANGTSTNQATTNQTTIVARTGQTSLKPQRAFRELINNSDLPFVPKLRFKHNSVSFDSATTVSGSVGRGKMRLMLAGGGEDVVENEEGDRELSAREWPSDVQCAADNGTTTDTLSEHPYAEELAQFEPSRHSDHLMALPETVKQPSSLENTPLIWVRQRSDLEALVDTLNSVHEFAFDLEHHSTRSFLGLTCLLQVSIRSADYLIDPFPLWSHMHLLNDPFTNPNITKVAFSADSDVLWLQRDFGIYVVGLFDCRLGTAWLRNNTNSGARDTGGADCVGSGGGSLAQMLADMLGIHLEKQFQMADWRLRPLTDAMVNYARSDTHFLLDCFDRLKLELAKHQSHNDTAHSALYEVYMQSAQICLLVFKQPRFNPMGYMKLLRRGRRFNNRQLEALARLWAWRDRTARDKDESLHFVLPEHMMLQIAETLPREESGILACCAPVPPIVRSEQTALHKIVSYARGLPLEQPMSSAQSAASVPAQERNADEVLSEFDANRITAQRAKLELRIDLSRAYKSMLTMSTGTADETAEMGRRKDDDGLGTTPPGAMKKLIEIANRWEHLKKVKQTTADVADDAQQRQAGGGNASELKKLLDMRRRAIRTVVVVDDGEDNDSENEGGGGQDEQHHEQAERRREQIRNRIEHDWVSPYDNYVLMARQKTSNTKKTSDTNNNVGDDVIVEDVNLAVDSHRSAETRHRGTIRATTIVQTVTKKRRTAAATIGTQMDSEELSDELEETTTLVRTKGKCYYSHLDEDAEVVELKPALAVKGEAAAAMGHGEDDDDIVEMDPEDRAFFAEPANLTNKARKRQRKKMSQSADVRFSN